MIISCPCGKKNFEIDANLIPSEGRNLQCGSCLRVWFYKFEQNVSDLRIQDKIKDFNEDVNKRDILNSSKVVFDTKEDEVLVFPSKTIHGTEQGKSNSERISISADIVFLAKDSSTLEHLVPPIENWKKFST